MSELLTSEVDSSMARYVIPPKRNGQQGAEGISIPYPAGRNNNSYDLLSGSNMGNNKKIYRNSRNNESSNNFGYNNNNNNNNSFYNSYNNQSKSGAYNVHQKPNGNAFFDKNSNNNNNNFYSDNTGSKNFGGHPRWKNLDICQPKTTQKQTVTGTNWDIRDGRHWKPESSVDIFGTSKETKLTGINFDFYDTIPVELTGEGSEGITPLQSFKEALSMHSLLKQNILRVDYEKPTPVQKYSISVILAGRDLMACAQTGSGKTAGFLLPILSRMLTTGPPRRTFSYNEKPRGAAYPVTLILSPTRELAVQIYKESRKFAFDTGIQTVVVYGGSDHISQHHALEKGCDICVATPGRLSEFVSKGKVKLALVKYFVLDEADRMLDMGFVQQIHSIAAKLPTSSSGRQTIMFSATFPYSIQELAAEYLQKYIFLTVGRVGSTNNFISQNFIYSNETNKPNHLINVLNANKNCLVLIFVETRRKADFMEKFLSKYEFSAVSLHGDKSQTEREKALTSFRNGEKHILVATDVAARGLDIYNIEHVINLDLPARIEDYVHRIGRTGRAGNYGKATSFVNETNKPILRDLLMLLQESKQETPKWLLDLVKASSFKTGYSKKNDGPRQNYHNFHGNNSNLHSNSNFYNQNQYNQNNNSILTGASGFSSRDARCNAPVHKNNQTTPLYRYSCVRADDEEDGW